MCLLNQKNYNHDGNPPHGGPNPSFRWPNTNQKSQIMTGLKELKTKAL